LKLNQYSKISLTDEALFFNRKELKMKRPTTQRSGYTKEDLGVYEEVDLSEDELDKIYAFYLYSDISILS